MEPINYNIQVKDPFENSMKGFQDGLQLNDIRRQIHQKEFAFSQQKQMQQDLGSLANKKNPNAQDFASITTRYPQLAEHFKNTWGMLNQDQQQTRLSQATQVYSALSGGQTDVAKDLLVRQRDAALNSDKPEDAQAADTMLKMIDMNPDVALNSAGLMLSSVLGPDKFASTFSTLSKLPGEVAQGEAAANQKKYEANNTPERLTIENNYKASEIRNLDSQISTRAETLKLDRDKLQSEIELKLYTLDQKNNGVNLDAGAKKLINDSAIASSLAEQLSTRSLNLATQLEKEGGGYGAFGSAAEWLKVATGNQDTMTQLRKEYFQIRNSQALKILPPGNASNKDVKFALEGFLPGNADAKSTASFLRGMAKLNTYESVTESAKSEWVNAVGHLGKTKTDIDIDGIKVPAGSNFTSFASQYVRNKVSKIETQQAQQQIQSRSYMKYAQPPGTK